MAGSLQSPDPVPKNEVPPRKRRGYDSSISFWVLVRPRVRPKRFVQDLVAEIIKDEVLDSAAVLAYFSMLSIFPAAILILSLLPYLPIPNLEATIISSLYRTMPAQAAELFTSTVSNVVSHRRGDLLSYSALGTVWAASSGLLAVMQRLHSTYDAKETRPYWKRRLLAIFLVFAVGLLVIGAFSLIILGDILHNRLSPLLGENSLIMGIFPILRWITILAMLLGALSFAYHFGPNVRRRYRFVTPGSLVAAVFSILSSLAFRTYVEHFGSYEATYGSLGAAIVLLLWFYVGGFVILLGAEVNCLLERYAEHGRELASRK